MKNKSLEAAVFTVVAHVEPSLKAKWQFSYSTKSTSVTHKITLVSSLLGSKEAFQSALDTKDSIELTVEDPQMEDLVKAKLVEMLLTYQNDMEELRNVFTRNRVSNCAFEVLSDLSRLKTPEEVLEAANCNEFSEENKATLKLCPMSATKILVDRVSNGRFSLNFTTGTRLFRVIYQENDEPLLKEVHFISKRSNKNSAHKIFLDPVEKIKNAKLGEEAEPEEVAHAKMVLSIAQQLANTVRNTYVVFDKTECEYSEFIFSAEKFVKPYKKIVDEFEQDKKDKRIAIRNSLLQSDELRENKRLIMASKFAPSNLYDCLYQEASIALASIIGESIGCKSRVEGRGADIREPDGFVLAPELEVLELLENLSKLREKNNFVKALVCDFEGEGSVSFPYISDDDRQYVVVKTLNKNFFDQADYLLLIL